MTLDPPIPPDLYLAAFADVHGWGGGVAVANGLAAEAARRGLTTRILGATASPRDDSSNPNRLNVPLPRRPLLWRVQHCLVVRDLVRALRRLPPPRRAFLAVSPFWLVAAKHAWPETSSVLVFPCSLTNCLPFTWPGNRPPGLTARLDFWGTRRAERCALERADRLVLPTRQALDEVRALHPTATASYRIACFGATTGTPDRTVRRAQRAALSLPDDACVFLGVGMTDRNKSFDAALDIFPRLDERAHLVLVGGGPETDRLAARATAAHFGRRVHVRGPQPSVQPWYAAADCVLSTSWYDTFPLALVDAMALGRPVILPQHDPPRVYAGMADVIRSDGGGLLYDRTRPHTLVGPMNRLVRDVALRAALGRAAQEIAEREFRWSRCLDAALGWVTPSAAAATRAAANEVPVAACATGSPE